MNKQYNITIGLLNHNNDIFEKYVKDSLKIIKDQCEIIIIKDLNPAKAYNEIIKKSTNDYILFTHIDVLFDDYFIESIKNSINLFPNFGAMGVVGVIKPFLRKKIYMKSTATSNQLVTTLDSCCILINKKHNINFDSVNFNEYHHFIEDYCMQVKYNLNLKTYLISTNFYCDTLNKKPSKLKNYFYHGSNTIKEQGSRWGKWMHYKKILDKKWNKKIITT